MKKIIPQHLGEPLRESFSPEGPDRLTPSALERMIVELDEFDGIVAATWKPSEERDAETRCAQLAAEERRRNGK